MRTVEADGTVGIDVRMEHLRDELDGGRLVRVLFRELQGQLERPILPRRLFWPKDDCVPVHDVIVQGGPVDTLGWICLHALEVAH